MLGRFTIAAAIAIVAAGCTTGQYVPKALYDRDIAVERERVTTLEALVGGAQLASTGQDKGYQEIAEMLKAFFGGMAPDSFAFDPARGVWTADSDLLFDSGKWKVTARGTEALKKLAGAYKGEDVRFRIVGHTDCAPVKKASTLEALETDTNLELSIKRALAVSDQLMKSGVAEKKIVQCVGMGNTMPVAPNDKNPANMKKNRRVEIFVLKTTAHE